MKTVSLVLVMLLSASFLLATNLFNLDFGQTRDQVGSTLAGNGFSLVGFVADNLSMYTSPENPHVNAILVRYGSNNRASEWMIFYESSLTRAQYTDVVDVLILNHGEDYLVEDGAITWDLGNNRSCMTGPDGEKYVVIYNQNPPADATEQSRPQIDTTENSPQDVDAVADETLPVAPIGRSMGQTAELQRVKTSFTNQGIPTISEGNIESAPAESRASYATISSRVNSLKGRINQIFVSECSEQPQSGSVAITLYIGADGLVRAADVVPQSGDLRIQFLEKVQRQVLTWRFSVSDMAKYRFVMQFRA